MKRLVGRWATKFERCVACGTTYARHQARGLCLTCYQFATYEPKPDGYIARHPKRWEQAERRRLKAQHGGKAT